VFPLWDDVIEPVIRAARARCIVEIGALRGETTVRMLKHLGAGTELHVIDPVPQFDPAEHERRFPGQYHFHQGTSHDVLPGLPAADVALIDGDHNWYTVYHELRMLAETAAQADAPLPVLVLHDVCWPYGRRDLYYAPERIPAEFRQPYERAGMRPGQSALVGNRGMNRDMDNADHEGGPRNGVMTAVDDFVAEHHQPLRVVVVPIYYGLAIVAEHRVLDSRPELAALLDHIESAEGQREVIGLAERVRVDEAIFGQSWIRMLQEEVARGADRYLDLVKAMLLDEHDVRQELRVSYLLGLSGTQPDIATLRDPARNLPVRYRRLLNRRKAGRAVDDGLGNLALTTMGRSQLDGLGEAALRVLAAGVPGDLVEVGVDGGGGSILLRATLAAHEVADRRVWVADRFLATLPEPTADGEAAPLEQGDDAEDAAEKVDLPLGVRQLTSDLNLVRDGFARFGLLDDRVRFLHGAPADTLPDAPTGPLALLRLGEGAPADIARALESLHGRLSPGAEVIVAGTANPAVEAALTRTRRKLGITAPIRQLDWNSVTWRHDADAASHHPVPSAAPARQVALSVVVVFHNMRREAARTLRSLTRSYQKGVEDLDYEVLVIDNGSDADERLSREYVASFGPEFQLFEPDDEPHPSPTVALNAGIAASRGDSLALMIDGAHVLTPGVLSYGMKALSTYDPAVVATQQWYVGPGQQGDAQQAGYDQQVEDRLFRAIEWPIDGYRLFEIGHFIGDRDWFDGIVESNCLFVPRKLLEQVGGFDGRFSMPGGGYANLDLFERLALSPDVTPASILGEGTFHQFHGGTTTNVADEAVRHDRIVSYRAHFEELRARPLMGLDKPVHYVGRMDTKAARRTRARRDAKLAFEAMRTPGEADTGLPVPDELRLAAIEAVWDHQTWREATWLGHPVLRFPADLYVYQELVSKVRPRAVVVAGGDAGLGGRASFLASVCDQLGSGQVVAVGPSAASDRPQHARITHVEGAPDDPATIAQVAAAIPGPPGALVFLGLDQQARTIGAFEHYAPMVPVGSYVVVENIVVRGRHSGDSPEPGPYEARDVILSRHSDFVPDPAPERYTVTFNRGGYLKRVAR
jgi:cephalosporin hydroxylase/glycosyltransferase involved in cell wall biosynthesis